MTTRFVKRASEKFGCSGTIVHVGEKRAETVNITVIDYDKDHLQIKRVSDIEEVFPFRDSPL
jgi:magnesium transporter